VAATHQSGTEAGGDETGTAASGAELDDALPPDDAGMTFEVLR
jgi:hypothetical protein